ncbi:hypothetical protein BC826DRAFT_530471 [Russula brevipes]|nr:hypothetical protein BC826DRAFT_530471 [Russula brevipes]
MPQSKCLLTDDRSNIFVYMTGHGGGDEFLEFQDGEEISAFDIADVFKQVLLPQYPRHRSSRSHQNSSSYENDEDVGVSVVDSYTHFVLEYLNSINKTSSQA